MECTYETDSIHVHGFDFNFLTGILILKYLKYLNDSHKFKKFKADSSITN